MNRTTKLQSLSDILQGLCVGLVYSFFAYIVAWVFAGFACHFATACTL